jgi:hypothetical protein
MMRAFVFAALVVVSVVVFAIACGGGARSTRSNYQRDHPSSHGADGPPPGELDAGVAFTGTRPLTCPSSYAELRGSCDPTVSREACSYAEGSCYCGIAYPCSGVQIPEEELRAIPPSWQCTPTPPKIRPDGCPGVQPGTEACPKDGQVCRWGDCCFTQMTCKGGTWEMTGGGCPP